MNERRLTSGPDAAGDLLRILGGLLLASGAIALFLRKDTVDSWGDFGQFLVLLIPCVLFYLLALGVVGGRETSTASRASTAGEDDASAVPAWRSVLLVFAVFLTPVTLFQFISLINGSTGDSLNQAWIFAATGGLAAFGAYRLGTPFAALLSAIAVLIAWIALWDKITSPAATTLRYLLIIIGLFFVAGAATLHLARRRWAVELVTAAGIALIGAGVLGIGGVAIQVVTGGFGIVGVPESLGALRQQNVWNVLLLLVSVALIVYGTAVARRGPTYVGGFGLFAFIISVGGELAGIGSGESPEGKLFWWPCLLVLFGAAGLAAGFLLGGDTRGRLGSASGRPARTERSGADEPAGEGTAAARR